MVDDEFKRYKKIMQELVNDLTKRLETAQTEIHCLREQLTAKGEQYEKLCQKSNQENYKINVK